MDISVFFQIILATASITLCVWAAVLFLLLKKDALDRITLFLVALSAGSLMGGAFLHLLPEAAEEMEAARALFIVLGSFIFFFFLEKLLHWRHCHKNICPVHAFGYLNLFGDSIHNFIDGVVIASTFIIDARLGWATTFAIAVHEIPQEIGDFGVLLHAGFHKSKAIAVNFLVALAVVAGGLAGYFLSDLLAGFIPSLLPFAAGGFIYIAASDLMPEIRNETDLKRSVISFLVFIAGIALMYFMKFFE